MMLARLESAQAVLAGALATFGAEIAAAHSECAHAVWIERPTFKVADWLSPHPAARICRGCRAEIHDRRCYDDWLSYGRFSGHKPDAVELVLTPGMAGLNDDRFFSLRLECDPRPHFESFAACLKWVGDGSQSNG